MVTIYSHSLDIFIFYKTCGLREWLYVQREDIFRYIRILFMTHNIFLRTQNRFFERKYFLLSIEERYSYTTKRTCFRKLVCEFRPENSLYIFVSYSI